MVSINTKEEIKEEKLPLDEEEKTEDSSSDGSSSEEDEDTYEAIMRRREKSKLKSTEAFSKLNIKKHVKVVATKLNASKSKNSPRYKKRSTPAVTTPPARTSTRTARVPKKYEIFYCPKPLPSKQEPLTVKEASSSSSKEDKDGVKQSNKNRKEQSKTGTLSKSGVYAKIDKTVNILEPKHLSTRKRPNSASRTTKRTLKVPKKF